jgi:hypothetical protein
MLLKPLVPRYPIGNKLDKNINESTFKRECINSVWSLKCDVFLLYVENSSVYVCTCVHVNHRAQTREWHLCRTFSIRLALVDKLPIAIDFNLKNAALHFSLNSALGVPRGDSQQLQRRHHRTSITEEVSNTIPPGGKVKQA